MTRSVLTLVPVVLVAAMSIASAAAPAQPAASQAPPSIDQLRDAFTQGDYARTLQQVNRALAVKGPAAKAYDRHDLLVLKGEACLRLKNLTGAAAAFDDAADAAPDEKAADLARAMAELVRRSKGLTYTPPAIKGAAAPQPFDICDITHRSAAFAALFDELRPKVEAAVKSAARSGTLPPMLDAFRLIRDLRVLERAATDNDTASAAIAQTLAGKARSLMARAVLEMADTVRSLEASASRTYEVVQPATASGYVADAGYMGLTRDQLRTLRQIASDCDGVGRVATDMKTIADAAEADALRTLREDAESVAARAREVARAFASRRIGDSAYGASGAGSTGSGGLLDFPMGSVPAGPREPGTNRVQRPTPKGNPQAGPRGVGTGGVGTGTR